MPIQLRDYQSEMERGIYDAWKTHHNVLGVLPTGAGKTVLFSEIIRKEPNPVCAIAHRQELVSQISLALARDGIHHKILGPKNVVRLCIHMHKVEVGGVYYNPLSEVVVAGVDTLIRRVGKLGQWPNSVKLWVQDEAHHLLTSNKWGKAISMFPNACGLGVTATPMRADGKGLGAGHDGIFDKMIVGPNMRDLINRGFLTDYKIFSPPSDFHRENIARSETTGDFIPQAMKKEVRKSKIMGDVVSHYLRHAPGKLGITFASDVETAKEISDKFNEAGVPADVVHAKTPDRLRVEILRKFKNRELLQIVNVDIFGEGFDLPAIEVVSFARPTESYGLYVQQFGRGLRIMDGKDRAIIIDHVGNILRHGLPDAPRSWTLERRERRDTEPKTGPILRACPKCTGVYEKFYRECPYCGYYPEPVARSSPEFVDGDLCELDPATLARMRGEVAVVDMTDEQYRAQLQAKHCPPIGVASHVKRHLRNQKMQSGLRNCIAWWDKMQYDRGRGESESLRRFYHTFGIDMLSAQALPWNEAEELAHKICYEIGVME